MRRRYCTDRAALGNPYVHLTNVAIQKKSEDYDKEVGCKWDLQSLKVIAGWFGLLYGTIKITGTVYTAYSTLPSTNRKVRFEAIQVPS